ncbi:DUF4179 domain-containing protein [Paenibacillus sp. FSL F4-0243]|uniref:DUF4179 domain-containing protein n=1 Tax=Paenibacillus sp. FSL F4-0243 TaxID=2954732 RepID=UPI0030D9CC3D
MKKLENMLVHQLNEDRKVPYPDFENMWERIEQNTETSFHTQMSSGKQKRGRNWSKLALVSSLSVLLAAAPVYAAVHYNWDTMLRGREGIQAALPQNLGQQLDQSVTKNGVTLKLHTAVVDENRTVILYTLDVGERKDNEYWRVGGMTLKGPEGENKSEAFKYLNWDEKSQIYYGYFESEWTPKQDTVNAQVVMDNIQAFSLQTLDLPMDVDSTKTQSFPIGQEGMRSIEVKPFTQDQDMLLLSSKIIFDQPDVKKWAYPEIFVYKNGTLINWQTGSTFALPGVNGEYTAKQYYKAEDVSGGKMTYKLQYMKKEKDIAVPKVFNIQLSKKQMENGTMSTSLNLPLEVAETDFMLEKLVVTPTQIRVIVRSKDKYYSFPYKKYALEIAGKTIESRSKISPDEPALTELLFERPFDLEITKGTPITFVAKYKVTQHGSYNMNNDDKIPLLLTNISQKKQTIIQQLSGYPVKWTYYMQGADLYVETGSEDARFGGINNTHIGLDRERLLGKTVIPTFTGDGSNKTIEVYKNFKGTEATIYNYFYTTDDPEKETRVQIRP